MRTGPDLVIYLPIVPTAPEQGVTWRGVREAAAGCRRGGWGLYGGAWGALWGRGRTNSYLD